MDQSGPPIVPIVVLCCCCLLSSSLAMAMISSSGGSLSLSGGAPSSTDPRAPVWSTGQKIQDAPLDISTQTTPFATAPTGINTSQPVSYTMSMDINIAQAGPSWRNVFNNGSHDCCDGTSRRPALFITGNDAAPANRVHIVHGANEDNNRNIVSNFTATLGKWFNVTWVVDGGSMKTYFNGVPDATVSGTFNWGNPVQNQWRWNEYVQEYPTRGANTAGALSVANVYWWNSALTPDQIATLAIPQTPDPNVATTSYYEPEPYFKD
jgi:Concanavalin A-like lectin/glucanases superfamily